MSKPAPKWTANASVHRTEEDIEARIKLPFKLAHQLQRTAEARGTDIATLISVALANVARRNTFYDLATKICFGKYRDLDLCLEDVIRCDPSYVVWCVQNLDHFSVSEDALALLDEIENREDA